MLMNEYSYYLIGLIFLLLIVLFIWFRIKYMKLVTTPCVTLFTGAPKTGKTLLSVNTAVRMHRRKSIVWFVKVKILGLLFKKFRKIEKPLLYSNIKLNVKCGYVLMTRDLLLRQKRFAYGSTILVSECSLVADSMNFKNADINDVLLCFNKLIGHETRGGHLIYDTQCLSDAHYSIKRCCSSYYYIVKSPMFNRLIPFFHFVKMKKMEYNADLENVVVDKDVEDTGYWYCVSKKTYKQYDRYCYSIFTDYKEIENNVVKKEKNLKTDKILMLRDILSAEERINKKGSVNNDK